MPQSKLVIFLLAAGLAANGAGSALAQADLPGTITVIAPHYPAKLERRVERALRGTEATLEQKIQVVEIIEVAQREAAPFRARLADADTAIRTAMAAMPDDSTAVERLQRERVALLDAQARRMARAFRDVAAVLNAPQRQAFFRNWDDRSGRLRG